MKESDLYIPARDWLRARGYTIHVEIFDADIIATKPDPSCHGGTRIVAVELKPCLSQELMTQLGTRAQWADEVWGVIASEPRGTSDVAYHGYGLLQVAGGKVWMLRKAKPQPMWRHKQRDYRLKKLGRTPAATENCRAGLPSCPELAAQRKVTRSAPASAVLPEPAPGDAGGGRC